MDLTIDYVEQLIACPKRITKKPRSTMQLTHQTWKNDFEAVSDDLHEYFHIFMSKNNTFPDNFSIGLDWLSADGRICLFRCNGIHGGNKKFSHHYKQHIHKLNVDFYNSTGIVKGDNPYPTEEYSTFNDALYYFSQACNITDMRKYFPQIYNFELFTELE